MFKRPLYKKKTPSKKTKQRSQNSSQKVQRATVLVFDYCPIMGFSFWTETFKHEVRH